MDCHPQGSHPTSLSCLPFSPSLQEGGIHPLPEAIFEHFRPLLAWLGNENGEWRETSPESLCLQIMHLISDEEFLMQETFWSDPAHRTEGSVYQPSALRTAADDPREAFIKEAEAKIGSTPAGLLSLPRLLAPRWADEGRLSAAVVEFFTQGARNRRAKGGSPKTPKPSHTPQAATKWCSFCRKSGHTVKECWTKARNRGREPAAVADPPPFLCNGIRT